MRNRRVWERECSAGGYQLNRPLWRCHAFPVIYSERNGFAAPKSCRGFRETGPRHDKLIYGSVLLIWKIRKVFDIAWHRQKVSFACLSHKLKNRWMQPPFQLLVYFLLCPFCCFVRVLFIHLNINIEDKYYILNPVTE